MLRPSLRFAGLCAGLLICASALALSLNDLSQKDANIEGYVTEQALNGLFEMIGKQEQTIRQNPAAAATSLAKKVFGTL